LAGVVKSIVEIGDSSFKSIRTICWSFISAEFNENRQRIKQKEIIII